MAAKKIEKLVPDTSIITGGILSKKLHAKELSVQQLIIHEAFISLLEHLASMERALGFIGLDELKALRGILGESMRFAGRRPSNIEVVNMKLSDLDTWARQLAFDEGASFMTTEKIIAKAAEANGLNAILVEEKKTAPELRIEGFFDKETMSVHLRENVYPYAKKGKPGEWKFVPLSDKLMQQSDIKEISREIIESPKQRHDSFIEIERPGSTIVQMGTYRIVITKPPFSDGWEITASHPIKKMSLMEYSMSPALLARISSEATGILIAGAPGSGKTTFASGLAEFYADKSKIVKTIEAPRDMVLSERITQYAISHGNAQEIHDILLLSRPDYSIFDEMRNTSDFELYIDLRLAGIGLAGVIHATRPIDAVQRFIKRAELGVIPQVIDTVVFIEAGMVAKALSINMAVKVPHGMTEADLARPIVEIRDFETKQVEYEMYSYGEETVVVPVSGEKRTAMKSLATREIERAFQEFTGSVEAEMVSENKALVKVPERDMARIIGKEGRNIEQMEKRLGIRIQLEPSVSQRKEKNIDFNVAEKGSHLMFLTRAPGVSVDMFIEGNYLFTSTTSKKGEIKINKKSQLGKSIISALDLNKEISLKVSA